MWRTTLTLTLAGLWLAAAAAVADEAELIAILKKPDATHKEKSDACRELAHQATPQAVPTLAPLLADEKLAHMARYTLEPLPDPSVDVVLRDALGKLQGRLRLGVIGSLGVRRDAQAVGALAKLLADADAGTAQAAARALGQIGTPEAAQALDAALAGVSAANRVDFCEGLFRCAEALADAGQAAPSQAIYDRLRGLSGAPQQVRAGALRGAILARKKDGVPLLREALRGDDYVLTMAAARTAMEMPDAEVTAALADELPKLPAARQILVINTLGYRGDAAAGPALLAMASQGDESVRLAAIRNVTHLGYAPALALLGELAQSDQANLAAVARECLSNFPGKDAEATIVAMLSHQDAKVRSLAVEMIGQRNVAGAAASLLKAAADADESVRLAALKALRDQAGQAELPALLEILIQARSAAELQATESALGALCGRQSEPAGGKVVIVKAQYGKVPDGPLADVTEKVAALVKGGAAAVDATNDNFGDPVQGTAKQLRVDYTVNGVAGSKTVAEGQTLAFTATWTPPAVVDALCAAMGRAQGEAKLALLRTLRAAGGPKSLATVQAATKDGDAQVQDTALRVLCDWPTPDAAPLLAELSKSGSTRTVKILAIRGLARLVPQQDAPDAQKVGTLREAMAQAERPEEKRLVLSALGNVAALEALKLVVAHLEDAALKEEACLAAVAIGEKLASGRNAEVIAAMRQVAKTTSDAKVAARANAVAGQANQ